MRRGGRWKVAWVVRGRGRVGGEGAGGWWG